MPKNAAQRLGPRSPLPPANTGFEIAQVPQEKPTDPYSPTAAGSSKSNDLMNSLGILSNTVVPVVVKAGEQWAKEEKKKGVQSRMVGDALAPNKSDAFIDGFERMDGSYRGIQFGNAAKEYAVKNTHLNAEEFQKGLDALQSEYVGKLIHQGQVDTFLPDALRAGEQATAIYQESKNTELQQETDHKIEEIYKGKVTIRTDQRAAEILGIPLAKGFRSIATDPVMRERYEANKEPFRVAIAQDFREIVEDAVSGYKTLGRTPRQLRERFADHIGRLGSDVGAEDINDVAYQNDASGNSMVGAFPKMVNAHADKARATGEHISNAMILRAEKARKAELEKMTGDWLMDLVNPNTTVATAEKIWVDVWNTKDLDADKKEKIANHAADVMRGAGFAQKDNQKVAGDLEYKIRTGKLAGEAANMAVLDAAPQLSPPTYKHLLAIAKEHKDKSGDHSWAMFSHEANTKLSNLQKSISLTDDLGRMMINLSIQGQGLLDQIKTSATNEWFRGVDLLVAKHGGAPFDGAELDSLYDRIIKHYTPQKEDVAAHYLATAGQETPTEPSSTKKKKASTIITNSTIPKGPIKPPSGIPAGYTDTGKTVGGKRAFVSPDGKLIEVEK